MKENAKAPKQGEFCVVRDDLPTGAADGFYLKLDETTSETRNLAKRLTAAALAYNLSILMRKLFGVGTPKQWAAKALSLVPWLVKHVLRAMEGAHGALGYCFAGTLGDCSNRSSRDRIMSMDRSSTFFSMRRLGSVPAGSPS